MSRRRLSLAATVLGIGLVCTLLPGTSRASITINPGWDLLETLAGGATTFLGQNFQGVPLSSYNFGGSIGMKSVGTTDTIVQRLASASVPIGPPVTVPIEMLALQLMSVNPFDPDGPGGAPLATYFVTLQSQRSLSEGGPGTMTLGTIDISNTGEAATHGTFDSFFDVFFDLRAGALNGPIVNSSNLGLNSSGNGWGHNAPSGALEIEDVNYLLNGFNTDNDFWPLSAISESHPSGAMHTVQSAIPVPFGFSPGAGLLICSGLFGLTQLRRKLALGARM